MVFVFCLGTINSGRRRPAAGSLGRALVGSLRWKRQGLWAPLLFMLIMAAVVVLLLPGALFTLGAGFVFGVIPGSVYVVLGTTAGAGVAFLLARYCFGKRAREFVLARAKLRLVNDELTPNGWKISIALLTM